MAIGFHGACEFHKISTRSFYIRKARVTTYRALEKVTVGSSRGPAIEFASPGAARRNTGAGQRMTRNFRVGQSGLVKIEVLDDSWRRHPCGSSRVDE